VDDALAQRSTVAGSLAMVLKLDPRYPLVWRDPFSLQVGVSAPVAVLRDVSAATERMVSALVAGISESGLYMTGQAAGATTAEVDRLLATIRPALVAQTTPRAAPIVLIAGEGPTVDRVADALASSGIRVKIAADVRAAAGEDCAFAIIVAQFVVPPDLHGTWLRRDIPHLPVVVSDTEVVIGPIVEPGSGPCLYCLQRYRTDADRSWPAIATQLHGRRTGTETALVASEAAAVASRATLERLTVGPAHEHRSQSLEIATGAVRSTYWNAHPECGCIRLTGEEFADASAEARPGTGSPGAGPRAVVTLHSRRVTASSARE